MKKLSRLLMDAVSVESNTSTARISLMYGLFICSVIAILAVILERDLPGTAMVIGALLAPLSVMKGIQSKFEK